MGIGLECLDLKLGPHFGAPQATVGDEEQLLGRVFFQSWQSKVLVSEGGMARRGRKEGEREREVSMV